MVWEGYTARVYGEVSVNTEMVALPGQFIVFRSKRHFRDTAVIWNEEIEKEGSIKISLKH